MMKYFFLFLIALVLSGGVAVAHPSPEFLGTRNTSPEKHTELVSVHFADNNAVAADGVTFETVVPDDRVLTIPKDSEGAATPIQFGIRIINNTLEPVRIRRDSLTPEFLGLNNEFIFPGIIESGDLRFTESDFPLIPPKHNITLLWKGFLSWRRFNSRNILGIQMIDNRSTKMFYFSPLMPGIFQIRFIYTNTDEETTSEDVKIQQLNQIVGVLTGIIYSPWTKIRLVDTGNKSAGKIAELPSINSTKNNAFEVNDVRFESVVPTPVFKIPNNQQGVYTPIRLGIRITNNTSEPVRFSLSHITPEFINLNNELISAGGIIFRLEILGKRNFPLILPKESFLFFLEGGLFWSENTLVLSLDDINRGRSWSFGGLSPGIFRVRFKYNYDEEGSYYDKNSRGLRQLRGVIKGSFFTNWAEINLLQP